MAEIPRGKTTLAHELRDIALAVKPDKDRTAVSALHPVILKKVKNAAKQGLLEYNIGCLRCQYDVRELVESNATFEQRIVVSDEVEKELMRLLKADGFRVNFYACDEVPKGHGGSNTFMLLSWW